MISREKVLERLENTGIRMEEETVVPINGAAVPLPYFVVRSQEVDTWDDRGRVCTTAVTWTISLFTANKDFALECKIRRALAGLGTVEISRYPDGAPYQTDFVFKTKGAMNK